MNNKLQGHDYQPFKKHIFLLFFLIILIHKGVNSQNSTDLSKQADDLYWMGIDTARLSNDYEIALDLLQKSLSVSQEIFGSRNHRLGRIYNAVGNQYKNLYQLENAYINYRLAEEMYLLDSINNNTGLAGLYSNLGSHFRSLGNYSEAIRYNQRALALYNELFSKDELSNTSQKRNRIYAALNLINSYYESNHLDEAIEIIFQYKVEADPESIILLESKLALIYTDQRKYEEAKKILWHLISLYKSMYGANDYSVADQYIVLGKILNEQDMQDSAMIYLSRAKSIYEQYENVEEYISQIDRLFADSWLTMKVNSKNEKEFRQQRISNLNQAAEFYLHALNTLNKTITAGKISIDNIIESKYTALNIQLIKQLGLTWTQIGQLTIEEPEERKKYYEYALNAMVAASELAMHMRTSFISEESKLLFSELQRDIFTQTMETAYELYELTEEIQYFNMSLVNAGRAKSAVLVDNIGEAEAREYSLIPDSLIRLENLYNANIAYYQEKLFQTSSGDNPNTSKANSYRELIFKNEQDRDDLRALLEKNYPEYFELKYQRKNLNIKDIQRSLKRNESIIEYVITKTPDSNSGDVYILAISKDQLLFEKIPYDESFIEKIITVHQLLSYKGFINSGLAEFRNYCNYSYEVYRKLIEPILPVIIGKRVTIIPDGILNYIPFEALITQKVNTGSIHYHDLPYLLHEFPISYHYSQELLIRNKSENRTSGKRVLALAPDYQLAQYPNDNTTRLASIPGTFEEVNFINDLLDADTFVGLEATEQKFRNISGDYDILHLAMHTIINDSLPMFSRLAFSPVNQDTGDDGWLNTADIYNLQLNARMTVLSACDTGTGVLRTGEGVMSLARGFLYAGSPTMVMTLWEVEDRSGTEIMKEFYKNLKAGKPVDIALRNAKLEHIKHSDPFTSHPHFWLGYISIGLNEPIFRGYDYIFYITLSIIMVLVIFDQWYRKKGSRKARDRSF